MFCILDVVVQDHLKRPSTQSLNLTLKLSTSPANNSVRRLCDTRIARPHRIIPPWGFNEKDLPTMGFVSYGANIAFHDTFYSVYLSLQKSQTGAGEADLIFLTEGRKSV